MRKSILPTDKGELLREQGWLDLEKLARVEISSEDPAHPIDSALAGDVAAGWRAAEPGEQLIRILFDHPVQLKRIFLRIDETERPRTQEFVLRWLQEGGLGYREIVRQQFNFNPPGTTSEQEEYTVELTGVTTLELAITPDIGGGAARATLSTLRLA